MKRKIEKKELQTRREFFKKAAKGALPIVAGVILAGMPQVMKATESTSGICDTCSGGCRYTCIAVCNSSCKGTCKTECGRGTCKHGCSGGCYRGCGNLAKY